MRREEKNVLAVAVTAMKQWNQAGTLTQVWAHLEEKNMVHSPAPAFQLIPEFPAIHWAVACGPLSRGEGPTDPHVPEFYKASEECFVNIMSALCMTILSATGLSESNDKQHLLSSNLSSPQHTPPCTYRLCLPAICGILHGKRWHGYYLSTTKPTQGSCRMWMMCTFFSLTTARSCYTIWRFSS